MCKIFIRASGKSFCNICHYRNACPPYLVFQSEVFGKFSTFCYIINRFCYLSGFLPSQNILKSFNRRHFYISLIDNVFSKTFPSHDTPNSIDSIDSIESIDSLRLYSSLFPPRDSSRAADSQKFPHPSTSRRVRSRSSHPG